MHRSLSLLLLALASVPLPAAIVYGVHSEPFFWSYSSTPINTSPFSFAQRTDLARSGDSLGVRMDVTNWVSPANLVEALRYEVVTVSAIGPIEPGWAVEFQVKAEGDYALGHQSLGRIEGRLILGGTPGPGGVPGAFGSIALFSQGFGDNSILGLPASGTFSLERTAIVPIPVSGSIGIAIVVGVSAQNNGYVNAYNSLHFGGARVIDTATGLPVAGATITAESGYDWTAPITSAVPEPATGGLIGVALTLVAVRRRARRK